MPEPLGPPPAYASLGDRALGQLVDGLPLLGVFFLLGMLLAVRFGGFTDQGFALEGLPALILLGVLTVVALGYFIVSEALFGVTLGKIVAETEVRSRDGLRIGMRAAVVRNLMRLVDGIVGYLVAAFSVILTSRQLRLGDLAAGTIVTRRPRGRAARAAALLVALGLGAGGIAGGVAVKRASAPAGGSDTARSARPVTAVLAKSVTADHRPIDPTTVFAPDAAAIAVAFDVTHASPGSRLKAVWTAIDVGEATPPNTEVDEALLVLPGPAPGTFRLRRGPAPWPVGEYRVDLYLNDELVLTLPYRVSG